MPLVVITQEAQAELASMDKSLKLLFAKHLLKFEALPPRRFLSGSNYCVENAGQGRIACQIEGETVVVKHIFRTHKEYEKWFRSGMP